jgi:TRAP-type C4-dicarboxylate transport system substrate-binding protein
MKILPRKLAIALIGSTCLIGHGTAQETRLLVTTMSPGGSGNSEKLFKPWVQSVNNAAGGAITLEARDGQALANFTNIYDRVLNDIVQIGWGLHPFIPGRFPLSEVAGLPLVSDNAETSALALWRLYKTGLLDAEYQDTVPLWMTGHTQYQIHFAKMIGQRDDLSGLKVIVSSKLNSQIVERLGGTPISLGPQDIYEALQRGTVDGAMISWSAFAPYKLAEVTAYHIEMPFGTTTSFIFMSRRKFNALPAAGRKALEEQSGEAQSRRFGQHLNIQGSEGRMSVAASPNHRIETLSGGVLEKWTRKMQPINDEWAASRANGAKVLETFQTLYREAKAGN